MFLSHFDKMDRYNRSTHSFQRQKWEHELVSVTHVMPSWNFTEAD